MPSCCVLQDKHGVFKVNHEDPETGDNRTQFGRMAESLGIELVYASTPQAKGRVERANQTLRSPGKGVEA
jgi:hypothetical protein